MQDFKHSKDNPEYNVASETGKDMYAIRNLVGQVEEKMAINRALGRHGWWDKENCPVGRLANLFVGQVAGENGDLIDAVIYLMFMINRDDASIEDVKSALNHFYFGGTPSK